VLQRKEGVDENNITLLCVTDWWMSLKIFEDASPSLCQHNTTVINITTSNHNQRSDNCSIRK
jgi:hypothetical protein